MVLTFGPFELDIAACQLRCDGRRVRLQPRVFDTLRYLIEHRGRLVPKQELVDALWGGQELNGIAVPWSVSHARKALGQHRPQGRYIETVRGRGYRFVAEVQERSASPSGRRELGASAVPRASDPFVGRDAVLLQLTAALDASLRGRGRLVLLTGEPGIGKTRCVSEFSAAARSLDLSIWSSRCLASTATPAFWPFSEVLRQACDDSTLSDLDRAEAKALLDQLVQERAVLPTLDTAAYDDARFWLLDRLSRFFVRAGRNRLRVLSFDDLHCADTSSLRALGLLAPSLGRARLLVIASARVNRTTIPCGSATDVLRLDPCERVALEPLRVEDVARYLAAALGEAPTGELSRAVHSRTAGNPLFVREAVRVICARWERDGRVRGDDVEVPEVARGFLNDRLAVLDDTTRAVLDAASVIGEEFDFPVLQRVTALRDDPLLACLEVSESVRIVERKGDGLKYGFVHPLMREVLYAGLAAVPRARLHAQVGLALETLAVVEPRHHQLAYHFHLAPAGEHCERMVRYGRLAGDAAMRVFAYDDAADYYAWAIDAQQYLPQQSVRAACDLLLASAAALQRGGRRSDSRKLCMQAIELARQGGFGELMIQAALVSRPSVTIAQIPDAPVVGALEDALALLPESAVVARALAYSRLASIPPYAFELERSRAMSDEAMRLAQASGDRTVLLEALRSRFRALSGPDTSIELLQVTEELLEADPQAASWWSADALLARYQTQLRLGDADAADRSLRMFGHMAEQMRARVWRWHYERMVAHRALQAGRLDEAEGLFKALFVESQHLRLPYGAALYAAQLAMLSVERTGRRPPTVMPDPRSDPWRWAQDIALHRIERIARALQCGELETGRREFHALAQDRCAAIKRDSNFLYGMARLSLAALSLGERDRASELYEILKPYAQLFAVSDFSVSLGCVSYFLGGLAAFLGHRDAAKGHLRCAIERNSKTGHEARALRSGLALAELLAASRSRDDRAEALALASAASAGAQRSGMYALRDAATVVVERLSARRLTPPGRPGRARAQSPRRTRPSR